jgi:hypothetical protein
MTSMRFAVFIMLQATEAWLALTRAARSELSERHVGASLAKYRALTLRYFDAEAFSAVCSDVMLITTDDLQQYYDFIETLRDSPMITTPYFRIVQIVPAVEDGFRGFEAREAQRIST